MNILVSFELAKLLKEKGFEERTKSYTEDGKLVTISLTIRRFNLEKVYYPSPTIAEVVMWLYEKHEIWIEVSLDLSNTQMFDYEIQKKHFLKLSEERFNSPTEAYEAAIEYTLNNLI